jgi:CBS domain-containing protein
MNVETILQKKGREVLTISPIASVKSAAQMMKKYAIAALVVTSCDIVIGVLSEREITRAFARHGELLSTMKVKDIIERGLVTISPEDSLKRAMELMSRNRVRHLPVLVDGKLAGIVSIGDIVKSRLDELQLETGVLRDIYISAH